MLNKILSKLNKEEQEFLKNLIIIDSVTLIRCRKIYDIEVDEEIKRTIKSSNDLSIIVFDIDHFKKFNDTYGHDVGDKVLKDVAQCVSKNIKSYNKVYRYGGEEFVIVLPNTSLKEAEVVSERVRKEIMKLKHKVTVSLGVCNFRQECETKEDLFKLADKALYHSKKNGRNKTTIYKKELSLK